MFGDALAVPLDLWDFLLPAGVRVLSREYLQEWIPREILTVGVEGISGEVDLGPGGCRARGHFFRATRLSAIENPAFGETRIEKLLLHGVS